MSKQIKKAAVTANKPDFEVELTFIELQQFRRELNLVRFGKEGSLNIEGKLYSFTLKQDKK